MGYPDETFDRRYPLTPPKDTRSVLVTFCYECKKPLGPEHVKEKRPYPPRYEILSCPDSYGEGVATYKIEMRTANA